MIIWFIIKLIVFNRICSSLIGLLLFIPFYILKVEKLNKLIDALLVVFAGILVIIECLITSRSVNLSLQYDGSRFSILWFIIGLILSTPVAVYKAKPNYTYIGAASIACWTLFCIGFFTEIDNQYLINKIAKIISVK